MFLKKDQSATNSIPHSAHGQHITKLLLPATGELLAQGGSSLSKSDQRCRKDEVMQSRTVTTNIANSIDGKRHDVNWKRLVSDCKIWEVLRLIGKIDAFQCLIV